MMRVRTLSDKALLTGLLRQATRLAMTPANPNWAKHKRIADSLRQSIRDMLIFEEYAITSSGKIQKEAHNFWNT